MRSIHERLFFRPLLEAFAAADAELLGRPRRRRGPPGRLRLHRRRAHPAGRARADPGPHPLVPPDAADAAAAARLAVGVAPTPTSACSACATWPPDRQRADRAGPRVPRVTRGGPPAVPPARHQPAGRPRRSQHNPDLIARLPDAERCGTLPEAELVERARRALAWRDDVARPPAGAASGGRTATCSGSIARDVLDGAAGGRGRTPTSPPWPRRASRPRWRRVAPPAALRRHRHGPLRRRRAVLRQRPRRALRLRRAPRRPTSRRRRRAAMGAAALRRRRHAGRPASRTSTSTCGPRASRDPSPAASTATPTYFDRWAQTWERQAMVRARPVAGDPDVAARFMDLLERLRLGAGALGRRRPRDPAHEGPHRAGAHPDRRGPASST